MSELPEGSALHAQYVEIVLLHEGNLVAGRRESRDFFRHAIMGQPAQGAGLGIEQP